MEWISVKDRLPINNLPVVVFTVDNDVCLATYSPKNSWENYPCSSCDIFLWSHDIIYWMELPEGPK